jgi:hypothetical protein
MRVPIITDAYRGLLPALAVGAVALGLVAWTHNTKAAPEMEYGATQFVTNGLTRIGSFPTGLEPLTDTSWRIDTSVTDVADITAVGTAWGGPATSTLTDASGWTELFSGNNDDDYYHVGFGEDFSSTFNGTEYTELYVGSNSYFTFSDGSDLYYDLTESSPSLPGVHICAADNSYQRILYRYDDAATLRIRYEGTDSTGGELGAPTMVWEVVVYDGESHLDLLVGRNDRCGAPVDEPIISGVHGVGGKLFSSLGSGWGDLGMMTLAYQWQRSGDEEWLDIPGATGTTYTLTDADLGRYVRLAVTADDGETSVTVYSDETDEVDDSDVLADEDDDDYLDIDSCEDLQRMEEGLNLNYELVSDIDCSGTTDEGGYWGGEGFWPIGDDEERFSGELDGHHHVISDLYIYDDSDFVGLFGYIDAGASVHDLGLEDADVSGYSYVGALAGALSGTVTNVYSTGEVYGDGDYVGGLVGWHDLPSGLGSSSPLVFTWNGEEYQYIADVGRSLPRNATGDDPAPIDDGALVPDDNGEYSIKISEEYNEIVYFDDLSLLTFDHAPGYQVVTSMVRDARDEFFTVADAPSRPMQSCMDMYGNDCLASLAAFDGQWSHEDKSYLNYWTMDFGDLSGAERIQLIVRGARDYAKDGDSLRYVQVKDAAGEWVDAYGKDDISAPSGSPRLQVIDLTGKFLTDDYSVRVAFDRTRMNYFAVDTSAPVEYTQTELRAGRADLGFHGFTAADRTYFWDHDFSKVSDTPGEFFATQFGNFTKYGDVAPLLKDRDDQFVIMHYGDLIDASFPYIAPDDGLERSFILNNWVTYKHADKDTGRTVEPLPYFGMEDYPNDGYPMTPENVEYLETWNTRVIEGRESEHGTIVDSWSSADVDGSDTVGGLVGYNNLSITGSHASGDVYGDDYVGGAVGETGSDSVIERSYALGDVGGSSRVGGFVGRHYGGTISESYAVGEVDGSDDHIGGFAGGVGQDAVVEDSFAHGDAEGSSSVGGFAGNCGGAIHDSYSIGSAYAEYDYAGGFVGYSSGCDDAGSLWDIDASGNEDSAAGSGVSTGELQDEELLAGEAGWNFEGVWRFDYGSDLYGGYPHLAPPTLMDRDENGYYEIRTCEELQMMRHDPAGDYELTRDIDCSGTDPEGDLFREGGMWVDETGFWPIGGLTDEFTGDFDGGDHTISNLFIYREQDYVGLFGVIGNDGSVHDLTLEDVSTAGMSYVGGLAGAAGGTITEVHVSGSLDVYGDAGGGLVGWHTNVDGLGDPDTIIDCSADVDIEGSNYFVGGLVGRNDLAITGSSAEGYVYGIEYVGGLVGENGEDGSITQSHASATVNGSARVGGLVGRHLGTIVRSYATGDVSGTSQIGGLTGGIGAEATVSNAFARGSVTGGDDVGGFSGRCGGAIEYGYSTGEVILTDEGDGGGFVAVSGGGEGSDACTVTSSFWDVDASGWEYSAAGSLAGTEDMTNMGFFASNGWSTGIWNVSADINDSYPHFVWQHPKPSSGGSSVVAPFATVSQPNGGQTLAPGSVYQVFWGAQGTQVNRVRVSYSTNGGSAWTVMADYQTVGGSGYNWTVPDVGTTTALVRVEAMSGDSVLASDVSDAFFTITGTSASGGGSGSTGGGSSGGGSTGGGDDGADDTGPQQPTSPNYPDVDGAGTSATGGNAMMREVANQTLPRGYSVDTLVKLASDGNPNTTEDSTVYYIGLDGMRHPFPTPQMFQTWYSDYSEVSTIGAELLASIPLGSPILVRPGTKWVKLTTDPKTYYVGPGYRLHWIKDEATAVAIGGAGWNQNVLDVSDALFVNFFMSSDIDLTTLDSAWPAGSLVKEPGDTTVWYVAADTRRMIVGPAAFNGNRFIDAFVRTTSHLGWKNKPIGAPVMGQEDALFSLMH